MRRKIKIAGLGSGVIPLTVVIMALWLYSQYEEATNRSLEQGMTSESTRVYVQLESLRPSLYQHLLREKLGDSFNPLDWIEITGVLSEEQYESWFDPFNHNDYNELTEEQKKELTEHIILEEIAWEQDLHLQFENLHYFVLDRQDQTTLAQGSPILEQLATNGLDETLFSQLLTEFRHVVIYDFNEWGEESVPLILNQQTQQEVERALAEGNGLNQAYDLDVDIDGSWISTVDSDIYNWHPFEPTTFVFGVPHLLTYQDPLLWARNEVITWYWFESILPYAFTAASIVAVVSFFTPLKVASKGVLIRMGLRIPLELMPFYLVGVFLIPINFYVEITRETFWNDFPFIMEPPYISHENLLAIFVHSLNIGMLVLLLGTGSLSILYMKNLFKQGFKGSLKNNSLMIRNILKVNRFFTVDLKEPAIKFIIIALILQFLVINFIFLPLAASSYRPGLFFIGGMILGGYSLILFFIFRYKVTTIQSQYLRLFEMTSEMSKGNLDIQIEENLGIFDSMKHQLSQIKTGFKKAVENETTSQRMKTELITNVSHDLKTPLTSIITYTDLLKDDTLELEKRKQYLMILEQKSHRLKVLIEDLFEMSKVSSGDIKLQLEKVDVVSLMKQTLNELEDQIHRSQLIIRTRFPNQKVKLMLDGKRTYRIFENLIMNIVKYALPKTRAYIDILEEGEQVRITFRNISASEINIQANELTERFVRGDKSRHLEGSGLGLAIAKTLVELQEGTFKVLIDGDLFKVIITFKLV